MYFRTEQSMQTVISPALRSIFYALGTALTSLPVDIIGDAFDGLVVFSRVFRARLA